jgi:hypothetical protein
MSDNGPCNCDQALKLKAQVKKLQAWKAHNQPLVVALDKRVTELEQALEAAIGDSEGYDEVIDHLRVALRRYGQHEDTCASLNGRHERDTPYCDCGLDAALGEG